MLFLFKTGLIDDKLMRLDLYFSFDHALYFHRPGNEGCDSHPLLRYFMAPVFWISEFFKLISYKAKGAFLVTFYTSVVALANVYVFRYLKNILVIKGYPLYLFTALFGCFSTNMILCFTPETYPISQLLLLLSLYFFTIMFIRGEKITVETFSIMSILVGGTTITNYVKIAALYLFTPRKWKTKIIHIFFLGFVMSCITYLSVKSGGYSFMQRVMWRSNFRKTIEGVYEYISAVINDFFGYSLLFPDIVPNDSSQIIFGGYNSFWQFLWIAILACILVVSVLLNFRKSVFQLLLAVIGVDFLIHVVLKYNLLEGFIFGGHWIYAIPLILGWLYSSVNLQKQKIISVIVSILLIVMLINNVIKARSLFDLASSMFPPV